MDKELEQLRKQVKFKEEKEAIEIEKQQLRDKLQEGTVRGFFKKAAKQYVKNLKEK